MTDAEMLLELADSLLYPRNEIIVSENTPAWVPDTVALAMRLKQRPQIAFRALVEEWSRFRIVRELH